MSLQDSRKRPVACQLGTGTGSGLPVEPSAMSLAGMDANTKRKRKGSLGFIALQTPTASA